MTQIYELIYPAKKPASPEVRKPRPINLFSKDKED